ncbi:cupin domain-containing protein [Halomicrococcus sp. NG-SE-24]|uniref:cupin domain-containing protein n=1 Tax=Halomicrococcus sp. NG-SE-24 TaxID=3436928 RepID=UPI003D98E305
MTSEPAISVVRPDDFERTDQAATRATVFETDETLLVRSRLDGGESSGWHTQGDRDAYGVVLEGRARIEYGPDGANAVEAEAGEFFHVPAGVVHRDANPGDNERSTVTAFVGAGASVVDADGPSSDAPGSPPRVVGEDDLVATAELANLTRLTPFPDADVQQVRGHADGRVESNWHHHGDNDVFGHVLDGEGYIEWGTGRNERKLARAGEFFHVPAGVVHRDVNPSDDEQDYVLWLTGSEPRNVPVDDPSSDGDVSGG